MSAETLATRTAQKKAVDLNLEYMTGDWVHETQDSPPPFTPGIVVAHSTSTSNTLLSDRTNDPVHGKAI